MNEIVLTPEAGKFRVDPKGGLAAILALAGESAAGTSNQNTTVSVVAGARNQRCLHLSESWLPVRRRVSIYARASEPLTQHFPGVNSKNRRR